MGCRVVAIIPAYNEAETVQAVACVAVSSPLVDEVIVSDAPRPDDLIRRLQPAVYAKGVEYAGRLPEQALVESYGGRVLFTETPKFSSSAVWHSIAPLDPVPWA